MLRAKGTKLEVFFGEPAVTYTLVLYEHHGDPSAVFAIFNSDEGVWESTPLPFMLRTDPRLLNVFVNSLREDGRTLRAPTGNPVLQ